jgi:MarR family transcriptional regulator, temperature-dependent positive regulator of motility
VSITSKDLRRHPGHLIRRVQQVHDWLWTTEVSRTVTSPQFAVLYTIRAQPDIDQKTLGEEVSLDRSTAAEVLKRLTARGLVRRIRDGNDARRNLLQLTAEGTRTVERLTPLAVAMNAKLVAVLNNRQQAALLRMLNVLVDTDEKLRTANGTKPRRRRRG